MSGGSMENQSDLLRPLKLMAVLNLILLSVQAWTGDAVNLFATLPSGAVNGLAGLLPALASAGPGPLALWHGIEGLLVTLLSIGISVSAFRRTQLRSVRIVSLLGLISVIVAALGGYLFVTSGFLNNGNSAQMGGAFLGAYAMNFLVLYYSK
jgi:hypothetical protein